MNNLTFLDKAKKLTIRGFVQHGRYWKMQSDIQPNHTYVIDMEVSPEQVALQDQYGRYISGAIDVDWSRFK